MKNEDEAIEMYLAGAGVAQIQAELRVHAPQLYAMLARRGIPKRRPGKMVPATDEEGKHYEPYRARVIEPSLKEAIVRMHEVEHLTGRDICRLTGVKYAKVLEVLHDANVQLVPGRSARRWSAAKEAIRTDVVSGMPVAEVMAKHGIGGAALNTLIRDDMKLRKADFKRADFYETVVQELMLVLQEQLGVTLVPQDGVAQLRLF